MQILNSKTFPTFPNFSSLFRKKLESPEFRKNLAKRREIEKIETDLEAKKKTEAKKKQAEKILKNKLLAKKLVPKTLHFLTHFVSFLNELGNVENHEITGLEAKKILEELKKFNPAISIPDSKDKARSTIFIGKNRYISLRRARYVDESGKIILKCFNPIKK